MIEKDISSLPIILIVIRFYLRFLKRLCLTLSINGKIQIYIRIS